MLASFLRFFGTLWSSVREGLRADDRAHRYALVLIILAAIGLRLQFLSQPMRYDEAYTYLSYASKPLHQGLSDYSHPNNHLFHTLQVHIACTLLGNKPWVIRLPAFLAGVLVVPACYLAIRTLYSKHAALLAAGIVASSSPLIEFSTNARGYSLICLIFLLLLALAASLKREREPAAWLIFSILAVLGLYTVPVMLYPLGAVVTWLLLSTVLRDTSVSRNRLLKDLVISLAVIALLICILYAPVIAVSGWKSVAANRFVLPLTWASFVRDLPLSFRSVWVRWNTDIPIALSVLFLVGFIASLALHSRLTPHRVPIIVAVVVWCIPVLVLQRVVPGFRVWLFLLPLYVGLASSGLVGLLTLIEAKVHRYKSVVCTIVALAITAWLGVNVLTSQSVLHTAGPATIRDAKRMTLFLKEYLRADDRVLIVGRCKVPVRYYFRVCGVPWTYAKSDLSSSRRILAIVNESAGQTLAGVLASKGLSGVDLGVPEVIGEYESATVYEMRGLREEKQE